MTLEIIYEDGDVVVLNKPAGVAVHPSLHNPEEKTLVSEILERWPEVKNVGEDPLRPGIVHRLDKETSGALVVAKTQKAFTFLKQEFKAGNVKKTYVALVLGRMTNPKGEIALSIGRSRKLGRFTTKFPRAKIRNAVTRWRVLKEYHEPSGEILTFLELIPQTGRTHQIRVHLAAIGHPVAGDYLYGGRAARAWRDRLDERQFLHASGLEFLLPSGKRLRVESELDSALSKVLAGLNPIEVE